MDEITPDQRRMMASLLLLVFTLIPFETLVIILGIPYLTNSPIDSNTPTFSLAKEEAIPENHPHAPENLPVGYFYNESAIAFGSAPSPSPEIPDFR